MATEQSPPAACIDVVGPPQPILNASVQPSEARTTGVTEI